jgi:hypothetical protein
LFLARVERRFEEEDGGEGVDDGDEVVVEEEQLWL